MELVYIYDGSFINLLSLILELIKRNIKPANIKDRTYNATLFESLVDLDILNDEKIFRNIDERIGKKLSCLMYYVFLSEEENKELIIYYFFLNALKYRGNIIYRRNLKCVCEVLRISQYVVHESHKFKGFLRFKELGNKVLYAEMEPTNDIIILISNHFKKRLTKEYWIIRDVKRGVLSIYDKKKFLIVPEDSFILDNTDLSCEEKEVENLWKLFYKTIGISERRNERCRMNFMPKKYWKYMLEVEDEL